MRESDQIIADTRAMIDETHRNVTGKPASDDAVMLSLATQVHLARKALAQAQKSEARLRWLHTGGGRDADGFKWGVFRVKWSDQGQPVEVWQTNSDFSDLDAEMRRNP